jgi:poly-gamma-glutamate synthesis protein (capsule biosynthesis protein)
MKIFIVYFLFSFLTSFRNCFTSEGKGVANAQIDSTISITISVVGDIMCHAPQFEYARVSKDSFDFNPTYRYISEHLSKSDFTFGNLETVTAGAKEKYSGYPRFNSPVQLLDALKNAGFDLLTTSNNHSLDRAEFGVRKTIEELNKREINYNGTYVSQSDRDSIRIFNIREITIAFLAYSYGTNGHPIPNGKSYLINLIDMDLIQKDIEKAKSLKPDLILVHYHFGSEYQREPNQFQRDVVQRTVEYGADIIIGGHPHVLQPVQFIESKVSNLDSVFVAYSLGNFISNQRKRYTDAGGILTLEISKNNLSQQIRIKDVQFTPTWVFKGNTGIKNEYLILPTSTSLGDTILTFLGKHDIKKMNEATDDTKTIVSKYYKHVSFK